MLGQVIHAELVLGSEVVHYKDDECPPRRKYPPTPAGAAPVKSRRVGFCLSSRQEEVTGFKSWRHRQPTTHTVFSASPTLPRSPFQTLSVSTAVSALPTLSTSSPPSLTAPTAPLPLSSLGRPCKCFRSIQRLPMCAQTFSTPHRLHRSHRPHATPPPTPPWPPLQVFWKYLKASNVCPNPLRPRRPTAPTAPALTAPTPPPPTDPTSWPPLQVF